MLEWPRFDFLVSHPSSIETPNLGPNFWNPGHLTGIGYSISSSISQNCGMECCICALKKTAQKKQNKDTTEKLPGIGLSLMFVWNL